MSLGAIRSTREIPDSGGVAADAVADGARRSWWARAWFAGRAPLIGVVAVAAGIGVWQLVITWKHPPVYIFPAPASVWHSLWAVVKVSPSDPNGMWHQLGDTIEATLIGYLVGSAAGIVLGVVSAELKIVEQVIFPYLVALQSLPKVALVPLLVTWFGFGLKAKVALVVLLVFFPVLLNTMQGVLSADPSLIDLCRSFSAGRFQRLWRIKLIGALNYIFVGLELGIVYALLGAVLAEMTGGGAQNGIGILIASYQNEAATDATFAVLIVLAIVGFILNTAVRIVHRRVVFWEGQAGRFKHTA